MADHPKTISGEIQSRMERYRQQLLSAGMSEPTERSLDNRHWFFYKPVTELTAFVVNLTGTDHYIKVMYGYASTAFTRMAGCGNCLVESGVRDEEITIREKIIIGNEQDEASAQLQIARMYERFLQTEKNALMTAATEKRKAFIQQIAVKLKPMGFKKKANTWTRRLEDVYDLVFNAQKSSFSDEYYFNIYIGKNGTNDYGDCYDTRVFPDEAGSADWQALSQDEFEFFLNRTVVPALEQIIHTPLRELGKLPLVWANCSCERKKCERCWVEKNRWEAKEA